LSTPPMHPRNAPDSSVCRPVLPCTGPTRLQAFSGFSSRAWKMRHSMQPCCVHVGQLLHQQLGAVHAEPSVSPIRFVFLVLSISHPLAAAIKYCKGVTGAEVGPEHTTERISACSSSRRSLTGTDGRMQAGCPVCLCAWRLQHMFVCQWMH
jgi:hypothetical protein